MGPHPHTPWDPTPIGLSELAWWGSYYIQAALFVLLATCLTLLTGTISALPFFTHTDPSLLFVLFLLFGLATALVGATVAALVASSRQATVACFLLLILGVVVSNVSSLLLPILLDPNALRT
jgi:uncharacterized membrane protein